MRAESVIGVLSGCGGAGASVFASILAGCSAARSGHAFLIDCDPLGGGIDVLLGCEQLPGPRWAQVRLRGGPLDPMVLRESLPRWQDVSLLAADTALPLDPHAVGQVIDSAASASPVLLDLPRAHSPVRAAAVQRCDRIVLVTPAEVRGVTASALVALELDPARTSLVVRGSSRSLPARRIGEFLGLPVLGELPFDPASLRPDGLALQRIRRQTRRVADSVLDSVQRGRVESAPDGAEDTPPAPRSEPSALAVR
ncbi:MAG: septum site-determining protein Ssd [Jatrophihabitans sp.]